MAGFLRQKTPGSEPSRDFRNKTSRNRGPAVIFLLLRWLQARQLDNLRAKIKPGYYSQAGISPRSYRRFKNGSYD
jgi:hypothetical protein